MFKYISKKLIFLPTLQAFYLIWQCGLLHNMLHASKYLQTFVSVIEFSIIVEILLAMHIQFAHLINDEFQPMQNCNILQLWHQFSVTNIFPFLHISLNLVAVHSIILLQCTTCNQLYSYKFASLWQGLNINHSTWLLCRLLYILYSLVGLVWPNTEELISRPFTGLYKIRLLLQGRMRTKKFRN